MIVPNRVALTGSSPFASHHLDCRCFSTATMLRTTWQTFPPRREIKATEHDFAAYLRGRQCGGSEV